jgi:hypothetical protein
VFVAGWDQDHNVRANLENGGGLVASGEESWNGEDLQMISLSFTGAAWFVEGANTVRILSQADTDYTVELFDKFTVTYPRYYQAATNRLGFPAAAHSNITVSGFTSSNITLLDVTDPSSPILISTTNVSQGPYGDYRASFEPAGSNYFAAATLASPYSITGVEDTHWRDATNAVRHVIVTVPELEASAQRLVDYRNAQGLTSSIILRDVLYNEFNHGIASPWAIRSFLSYAATNWAVPPRYLVLGGAGTIDFKDFEGAGSTDPCHIPPVVVFNSFGLFGCDNPMADIDGDRMIDVSIGRLPAADSNAFDVIVDKIIAYETGGDWRENVMLVADNEDAGGFFWGTSDQMADQISSNCTVEKIYLDTDNMADVRSSVGSWLNAGAGYFNYMGHGNEDVMADLQNTPSGPLPIMNTDDLTSFTNSARPALMSAMTCRLGRFALPGGAGDQGLGEGLLTDAVGGGVAMWAPVSESFNPEGAIVGTNLYGQIFSEHTVRFGDAILAALENARPGLSAVEFLLDTFCLLGDPALVLAPPGFSFQDWQPLVFTPSDLGDPEISGPSSDPEGDGLNNTVEFAFNYDPTNYYPVSSHLTPYVVTEVVIPDTNDYATVKFPRRKWYEGIEYEISITGDLTNGLWSTSPSLVEEIGASDMDDVMEEVTVRINPPLAVGDRIYVRLRIVPDP